MEAGALCSRANACWFNVQRQYPAPGQEEANQVSEELKKIEMPATEQSPIALVHDYEACWMTELDGQTHDFHYTRLYWISIRR